MDILIPRLLKQQNIEKIDDPPDSNFGIFWDPVMQFKGGPLLSAAGGLYVFARDLSGPGGAEGWPGGHWSEALQRQCQATQVQNGGSAYTSEYCAARRLL
jgi:hypothetical protein